MECFILHLSKTETASKTTKSLRILYKFLQNTAQQIHKEPSKPDFMNKYDNTYRYLDDIFVVNNPGFSKYVAAIYPRERTSNKLIRKAVVALFWI